jgi:hypothetical protein
MPDNAYISKLNSWQCRRGYVSSGPKEIDSADYMDLGSVNFMLTGQGKLQVFKGVTERDTQDGGIIMQTVAETWASLGQTSDLTAYGNVLNAYTALFYIGKGLLRLAGESLLVTASSTLSLLLKRNGTYTDPESGPWQAGLAVPSAPIIRAVSPPAGFTGKVNGVVSVVIWRIRSTTGAVSIHSEVSNIVAASNESIAVTLPLPDANGQDYWGIGVTKQGEGRFGSHFVLPPPIPESDVAEAVTRTDIVTNAADLDITSATGLFTSEYIGWVVELSGGTPACVHSSFVTAVPDPNTLTLDAMPPTTSTGVSMTLSRGEGGTERTVVIEWRDGELVGQEFAPTRDFQPPAGLFAGALEDVLFVDGAYADAAAATSGSNPGSAIAPSERGRPESFSPDTVIFTNDTPTALIRGDGLYWRTGRNSVMVIRYLGGDKPLSVEPVWEGIGILYQHNGCLGEGGRLYLWATERGPVRMGTDGLPDTGFANEAADDLAACTNPAKRVLGWYPPMQVVVFCYEKKIWPYFTQLGLWGAPADLTGLIGGTYIRSAVPDYDTLLISDDQDNLYEYNVGTGTVGKVRTGWMRARNMLDTIASVMVGARIDDDAEDVTIRIFADGDGDTIESEIPVTPARTGYQRLPVIRPNVQQCESYAIEVEIASTTATGDTGIETIEVFGDGDSYQT